MCGIDDAMIEPGDRVIGTSQKQSLHRRFAQMGRSRKQNLPLICNDDTDRNRNIGKTGIVYRGFARMTADKLPKLIRVIRGKVFSSSCDLKA